MTAVYYNRLSGINVTTHFIIDSDDKLLDSATLADNTIKIAANKYLLKQWLI